MADRQGDRAESVSGQANDQTSRGGALAVAICELYDPVTGQCCCADSPNYVDTFPGDLICLYEGNPVMCPSSVWDENEMEDD
jgi:hypothetical protein